MQAVCRRLSELTARVRATRAGGGDEKTSKAKPLGPGEFDTIFAGIEKDARDLRNAAGKSDARDWLKRLDEAIAYLKTQGKVQAQ